MSYNISGCRVKKCTLRIPKRAMMATLREKKEMFGEGSFDMGLDGKWVWAPSAYEIEGHTAGKELVIDSFMLGGEFSGIAWSEIVKPLLAKSKGALVATFIWEGGDTISKVTVLDGKIEDKEVDI